MTKDEYFSNKNQQYYVPDVANCTDEEVEIIFICESPHKDEIKEKIPLCGMAGKDVAKFLFGKSCKKSLGQIIKERNEICNEKLAIVNVCNRPLQMSCLVAKDWDKKLILALENIRNGKKINEGILKSFEERIKKYNNVKKIIVCGHFAERYYKKIKLNGVKVIYVPHPSRHQWQFIEKHKDHLNKLKKIFK